MKRLLILIMLPTAALATTLPPLRGETVTESKVFEWSWKENSLATAIVFLSSVCPCSNSHITHLKSLKEKHPRIKFIALYSNVDENKDEALAYFRGLQLNFDLIRDQGLKYADAFKAYKTPHSFLVSPEGRILYQGGVTNSSDAQRAQKFYLEEAIKELESGKDISLKEARTLGCEISRS